MTGMLIEWQTGLTSALVEVKIIRGFRTAQNHDDTAPKNEKGKTMCDGEVRVVKLLLFTVADRRCCQSAVCSVDDAVSVGCFLCR